VVEVELPGFPGPLRWDEEPAAFQAGRALTVRAGPETDLFIDPGTGTRALNAPRLLGPADGTPDGDFLLSARVEVGFAATFDAGALILWAGEDRWAKLAYELSPQGEPTVVSVVTRGASDDCNAFSAPNIWLRVARLGPAYAFHASLDGATWRLIRYFALDAEPRVGFEAQSPVGTGCQAVFDHIAYEPRRLAELRDGS
jgi:uncharacterized protein